MPNTSAAICNRESKAPDSTLTGCKGWLPARLEAYQDGVADCTKAKDKEAVNREKSLYLMDKIRNLLNKKLSTNISQDEKNAYIKMLEVIDRGYTGPGTLANATMIVATCMTIDEWNSIETGKSRFDEGDIELIYDTMEIACPTQDVHKFVDFIEDWKFLNKVADLKEAASRGEQVEYATKSGELVLHDDAIFTIVTDEDSVKITIQVHIVAKFVEKMEGTIEHLRSLHNTRAAKQIENLLEKRTYLIPKLRDKKTEKISIPLSTFRSSFYPMTWQYWDEIARKLPVIDYDFIGMIERSSVTLEDAGTIPYIEYARRVHCLCTNSFTKICVSPCPVVRTSLFYIREICRVMNEGKIPAVYLLELSVMLCTVAERKKPVDDISFGSGFLKSNIEVIEETLQRIITSPLSLIVSEEFVTDGFHVKRGLSSRRHKINKQISDVPKEEHLPPALECEICSLFIQPVNEDYFEFQCGHNADKPKCTFPSHKSCLNEHFKVKRAQWKGKECPREGCRYPMLQVLHILKNLERVLYIRADSRKKETAKWEAHWMQTKKKGKNQNTNQEKEDGDEDFLISVSPISEPEEESHPEPSHDVLGEVVILPSPVKEESPEEKLEKLRRLKQPAVPLAKKKDEAEVKYTVTDAAVIVRNRSKKLKNVIPVQFQFAKASGQGRPQ